MPTQNIETLQKIVALQSCIIQGRDINAMLHKDRSFYQGKTQADIIAVYVNEHEYVNVEYVVEEHHLFESLVDKYVFSKKSFKWKDFIQNCENHFTLDHRYHHTYSLYEIFKGFISKEKALEFSKEIGFKEAVMMPIYAFDKKEVIGHICFIFQKEVEIEITGLLEIKTLFETLLQPLYDNHYSFIYSKCIRVDEHLKLLTKQEKRIAKKVLQGKSYPEIAEILNLSLNTVKTHMKSIFNKYNVNSKMELYNKLSAHVK
jgi:DNA-binding CsgD family transcriptional regulator